MARAQRKDIKQGRTFWSVEPFDGEVYTKKVFITRGLRAVWSTWSHRNNEPYIFGYKFVCRRMETIYPDGRREVHPTERDYAYAGVGGWKTKSQKEIEHDLHRWLHRDHFTADAGFSDAYWKSRAPGEYVRQMIEEEDHHAGDYFGHFFGRKAFTTERSALRYMKYIVTSPLYPKMKKWRNQRQKEESELYDDWYDDVYAYPDAHEPDDAMHERGREDDRIDEQCSCPKCESVEAAMNPDLKYDAEDPGSLDRVLDPDIDRIDNGPVNEDMHGWDGKVLKLSGNMRVVPIERRTSHDEQEEAGGDTAPT